MIDLPITEARSRFSGNDVGAPVTFCGELFEALGMKAAGRIHLETVFLEVQQDLARAMRRRLGSAEVAADLIHDVYLKCRHVRVDFPDHGEARAYLLRMASNLAIDYVRVERRRKVILGGLTPVFDAYDQQADSPEAHALASDKARQIEAVLVALPKLTRQMFVLVRLHGLTHKEVADKLNVSKSLVDKYMLQALLRCRDSLGGLDKVD